MTGYFDIQSQVILGTLSSPSGNVSIGQFNLDGIKHGMIREIPAKNGVITHFKYDLGRKQCQADDEEFWQEVNQPFESLLYDFKQALEKEKFYAQIKEVPMSKLTDPKSEYLLQLAKNRLDIIKKLIFEFENWVRFIDKYMDINPEQRPEFEKFVGIVNERAMDKMRLVVKKAKELS